MSDEIKHECGVAFIRLRKSFSYYQQKYGTVLYGLNKLYLLMEKQHNRGQDGAGGAGLAASRHHLHGFNYALGRRHGRASPPVVRQGPSAAAKRIDREAGNCRLADSRWRGVRLSSICRNCGAFSRRQWNSSGGSLDGISSRAFAAPGTHSGDS